MCNLIEECHQGEGVQKKENVVLETGTREGQQQPVGGEKSVEERLWSTCHPGSLSVGKLMTLAHPHTGVSNTRRSFGPQPIPHRKRKRGGEERKSERARETGTPTPCQLPVMRLVQVCVCVCVLSELVVVWWSVLTVGLPVFCGVDSHPETSACDPAVWISGRWKGAYTRLIFLCCYCAVATLLLFVGGVCVSRVYRLYLYVFLCVCVCVCVCVCDPGTLRGGNVLLGGGFTVGVQSTLLSHILSNREGMRVALIVNDMAES